MKTIDVTPTWSGIMPILVELANNAETVESRRVAMDELRTMASLADKYNELVKAAIK